MKWLDDDYIMDTWNKKYRNVVQVDENTVNSETLQQWFNRVCNGDEKLIKRMEDMKFLFGGRILANRGLVTKDHKVTLSNCYVLPPVEDNIHSIMKTAEELAVIFSRGGGVGIDISKLRYKGAPVRNSAETTTGACSFMQLYDVVTSIIGQKGRRGALIITMDCDHPDIHDFIDIKKDLNMINNANISVKVSDRFMHYAVEKPGKSYSVRCKITDEITGAVWHEHVIDVTPSEILQHIAENNWRMAEPGIIFKDAIEDYNFIEKNPCINITGVNPCGELPLPNYGSCNLGNINLSAYVKNPFTANAEFDFVALTQDVPIYVKALNDVLLEGKDYHPIQEQRDAITRYRQIGLGVTGLADMLIKMRVLYGSEEACKLIAKVYSCIINQAVISSVDYAVLNSYASYEGFDVDDFCNCEFAKNTLTRETKEYVKRHGVVFNSQFLTIPPTGSVSIVLGNCSSGVEPNFDWQYNRKIESIYDEPRKVLVTAGIIKEYAEYLGMSVDKVLEVGLPDYFVTATEGVTYRGRVNIQSACQDYIDGAISGTVNLPNDATVEQIVNLYKEAWLQGLKGITVYRVGSEREGILTKIEKTPVVLDENNTAPVILKRGDKKAIAPDTIYYKEEVKIGCGELNLFIGYSPSEKALQDFWVKRKGNGGCERNIESTVISMSLLQRVGGSFEMLEESFKGIGSCNSFVHARSKGAKLSKGSNCGQAIFNTIYDFVKRMQKQDIEIEENKYVLKHAFAEGDPSLPTVFVGNPCPVCGKPLHRQGGCYTCDECGYSKCD
jgi:ribonucleoside-diphosphate reductase alpha chain|nr:MAG TPA: ribonucleoside-diphosphate reductase, adenosylcobalamin-dependent [Bacteriophage sp.]